MWSVRLRNAAGREQTVSVIAGRESVAADRAVRAAERATGERWYAVTVLPRYT